VEPEKRAAAVAVSNGGGRFCGLFTSVNEQDRREKNKKITVF